ncbi:helix-turn-helix transcriptional regulator [Leptonema illini]|uniref:Transcriptional regulator, AraC family n=1 Tax=Leptonema illini DSM 21528 TaxID=929563 RepID=H2CLA6_9LEPT|nr:helix-turn-helix transcriptional regulator [Leptonema illini]EHQ08357.1 transcriptional regulator, AraC family [Leptonema illini DSM 21528]
MQTPGGILYVWTSRALFATDAMVTELHEHYAATLAIGLDGPIPIETAAGLEEYRVALLGPNTFHRTINPGSRMVALVIDPETYEYASIARTGEYGKIRRLPEDAFLPLLDQLELLSEGALDEQDAWTLHIDMLQAAHPFRERSTVIDERIRRIAERIRKELPDSIRMKEIGKDFSISEDRLIRLFKQNLGIPLRRYLLWVRLLEASRHLKEGWNLTDAAHSAGFADSAHFTRTFKENFGFVPSFFFGQNSGVDVRFCETEN